MKQKWPRATGNQLIYSLLRNAQRPDGSPVWEARRGFGATSFEATLTTDPTTYPDVMPIYASMGNVVSDQPTPPVIPQQVDSNGRLPDTSATPSVTAVGADAMAAAAPAVPRASTTSGTAWLVWLVCGVVAVAVLVGGGWALTRNRAPRTDLREGAAPEGSGSPEPRPGIAAQSVGRPAAGPGPDDDSP
jgi:hypothetical protein